MIHDLRLALRTLVRNPLFTVIAGVTLAVGIGANTAIFSVVDGVLINPLPYPEAERLVSYNHQAPRLGVNVPVVPHSESLYLHYLENARSIEAFAIFTDDQVNLITDGDPQQINTHLVTKEFFEVSRVPPFLGRGFAESEDRVGAEPVAVLSYGLWEQNFGADPSVVGSLVEMDGVRRRIVGVMPPGFGFASEQLWLPLEIDETNTDMSLQYIGVARLADAITMEAAEAEMQDLLLRFIEAHPDDLPPGIVEQTGLAAEVKPLKDVYVQDIRQALWVLLGMVGFVLLIACANVANLFLVRAEARQREQAVRTAMGAGRLDMIRQYLAESVTLALGGGLLGLGLAAAGVRGLMSLAPVDLPRVLAFGIDGSVLAFTALISVAAGILFGLLPILGYGRPDLAGALKEGGRSSTTGRERHRARSALVVAQVALALVLLVGSGLMLRSFIALRAVNPGFEPQGSLTFHVAPPTAEYDAVGVHALYRRLVDRLADIPGVRGVGIINGMPLVDRTTASPMERTDRPFPEGELGPLVEKRSVTPGFFRTLDIPVREGRDLTWDDRADGFRAVIISQALANAFWPGESAVGHMIRDQGAEHSWEVVGVVGDVRFEKVEEEPREIVYLPTLDGVPESPGAPYSMDVILRVGGDPLGAIPGAREALREIDPRLPMINPRTVESVVADSMASTSFTVLMLGIAAAIALLLGAVGLYGVVSYIVGRRTHEIGVRMALGAPAGTVLRSVVGQGMTLTAIGLIVGLVGAWGVTRALASLLYGVSDKDPLTYVGTAAALSVVALLASWIPARRASRVDPATALRAE